MQLRLNGVQPFRTEYEDPCRCTALSTASPTGDAQQSSEAGDGIDGVATLELQPAAPGKGWLVDASATWLDASSRRDRHARTG